MKATSIALILAIVLAVPALALNDGFDGFNDGFDGWNDGFDGWNNGFDGFNNGFDGWNDGIGNGGSDGNDQNSNDWNNNGGTPPNNDWNQPNPNPNPFNNQAPILNTIGSRTVFEGQQLSFGVSGSDPDGQQISFSANNLPSGASFSGQTFSWTPNSNQQGQYLVNFIVTDSMGATDSEAVQITVLDVAVPPPPGPSNHAPVFLSQPTTWAYIRELYFSQVIVFDADNNQVSLNLATAPAGMELAFVDNGYTVFAEWLDSGDTDSEDTIAGDTLTVTVHGITDNACDVTINDRRMTFQENTNYLITLGNGVQYQVNVESDFNVETCLVEITDNRITTGWLLWIPEPTQQGSNAVSLTASDGFATTAQNFNVLVTVDPRTIPTPDAPRGPRQDIHVNTIALPDEARAGDVVIVTLNFENSGDLKLEGAEATISIPELGIRSPTIGPLDLRINKDVSRSLVLEIPEDAADGLYTVRVTIDSGSVHRIVHRDIEIVSD